MLRRTSVPEDVVIARLSMISCRTDSLVATGAEALALIDVGDSLYGSLAFTEGRANGSGLYRMSTKTVASIPEERSTIEEIKASNATRLSSAKQRELIRDEFGGMIQLAVPVILTHLLEMLPGLITIILVGRVLKDEEFPPGDAREELFSFRTMYIDAAAMAVMFVNVVGMTTGLGILSAMDTLCAHAHGANQQSVMGTYLLTGIVVISVVFLLVSIAILNTTNLLLLLGQPPIVAENAGLFANYMLPGLPFIYAYELLRKMSQARNETLPMVLSAVVSNLINIGVGCYLVNNTGWGWLGAAIARTLGNISLLPTIILGMLWFGGKGDDDMIGEREFFQHVWEGFDANKALSLKAILKFLHLGVPGMLQLAFEWIAFEVLALLCGILPDTNEAMIAIGANVVILNISALVFMVYAGSGVAASIRVGNALGAGDVHRAKIAAYLSLGLGGSLSLLSIIFLLSFRETLPYLFTSDIEMIKKAQSLFTVVAIFQIPDAINAVSQGIFRGSGRQSLAAKFNFIAYYVIGLPLGYIFEIPMGIGVAGLWCGMTLGLTFVSTSLSAIVMRSDWASLSSEARKRMSMAPNQH